VIPSLVTGLRTINLWYAYHRLETPGLRSVKMVVHLRNRSHSPVVPKLFQAVTQIEVEIRSYYPQYIAVIPHNIEQNCSFGSALSPEESHITPGGNLPPVWEPLP